MSYDSIDSYFPQGTSAPSKKSAVLIDPNITMDDAKNLLITKNLSVFYEEIKKKLLDKTTNKTELLNELQDLRGRNGYIIPPFINYYGVGNENISPIIKEQNDEINNIIRGLPVSQPIEIGGRKRKKRYTKKNKRNNKKSKKRNKKN
jgi:hypothetical protein